MSPAPTIRMERFSTSSYTLRASSIATPGIEVGRVPTRVSVRTRLPAAHACWKSRCRTERVAPAAEATRSASRTWARIWSSPTTSDSSPAARAARSGCGGSPTRRGRAGIRRGRSPEHVLAAEEEIDDRVREKDHGKTGDRQERGLLSFDPDRLGEQRERVDHQDEDRRDE